MKHRYLPLAMSTALAALAMAQPADASERAPDEPTLSSALSWTVHPPLHGTMLGTSEGELYWVDDEHLAEPAARTAVVEALDRGRPVLVTRLEDAASHAVDAFGFDGGTMRTLYRRGTDHRLEVAAIDDAMSPSEAAQFLTEWLRSKRRDVVDAPQAAALTDAPGGAVYSPQIHIIEDKAFEGGRRIAHDITVLREVTASRDEKVVLVKTQVNQRPEYTGRIRRGTADTDGKTTLLSLPLSYRVLTQLTPSGKVPLSRPIVLENAVPLGGKPKERRIDEKVSSKRSTGWSLDKDIAEFIGDTALGKLPVKFNGGEETSEERTVSMTVDDYEVLFSPRDGDGGARAVQWSFDLARDIADNRKRFESGFNPLGDPLHTDERFTPMMRSAAIETASTWRIPGAYEGKLDIVTRANVINRLFGLRQRTPSYIQDEADDGKSDIHFGIRLDLGSPRLTRQPTVRIQSLSANGACLTQPDPAQPLVTMQACEKGDGGREQQWYLESDHTYRNRGSGQCLTAEQGDGSLSAAACAGASLDQQWQWSADRLHSRLGGGNWRLHLRDGVLNAMFDPQRHQIMVPNHYHDLLRPWSSYPNPPTAGDVIPNPRGASPRVPDSYLTYTTVSPDERWQLLPVIYGQ